MNTANVSVELRLKMFESIAPENIIHQDELNAIDNEFGETITVCRGATLSEVVPGIDWTKYKWVVEGSEFNKGKVFMATINKSSILLCFAQDEISRKAELAQKRKTLSSAQKRMEDMDKIIHRLYEDSVLGKLSDTRFSKISTQYETE